MGLQRVRHDWAHTHTYIQGLHFHGFHWMGKFSHWFDFLIWKTLQWPQDWKRSVFIPIPNKGNAKDCSSSVQFSHSVMSDSLWPHGLQHARPPCPSPTPGVYSNSCPLSWWCHSTISSSVVPVWSHLQSFPASGSFQMSLFFSSSGQSIRVSASALVLPTHIQTTAQLHSSHTPAE